MPSNFFAEVAQRIDQGSDVQPYTPSQVLAEQFIVGDLLVYDAVNDWMERCGADPALIAGISEVYSEKARLLTEDGKVPCRLLNSAAILRFSSATTPLNDHVGNEYGVTRAANGNWQLDIAKVGVAARFTVVRIDIPTGSFYCTPLAEFLQLDGIDS